MGGNTLTITIPDIENMSDEDFAHFARMHDGRWSEQTKAMMLRCDPACKIDPLAGRIGVQN